MKHYMDITRAIESDNELKFANTLGFDVGDNIVIQEKVDGANASCYLNDGKLIACSRKQELDASNNLRGFWQYIQNLNVENFLDLNNMVIFGEWLVRHTVSYNTESYNEWYIYDIYDRDTELWLPQNEVKAFADSHNLKYVHTLYSGEFISWQHCKTFLNSPAYGNSQEGIVIKNQTKLNSPDEKMPFYLKIVNDSFKEVQVKNHVKKIEDPQKISEQNDAKAKAEIVVTNARVKKEINKMIDEGILPEQISSSDMGIVAKNLPKRIFDDVLKEESEVIGTPNQFFGKMVSAITMKIARQIILGVGDNCG